METKLCRICGKLGQNYINIFKTEGLKNKVETCLPIIVSRHSLLPDMICGECSENVDNFYSFIKNCLQNIIILEAQYDITESCLKTKRKHEKSCLTDATLSLNLKKQEQHTQTDDYLDLLLKENEEINLFEEVKKTKKLVDYEIESDTNSDTDDFPNLLTGFGKNYFDDRENYLINEIALRKTQKRKPDDVIENSRTKIFKIDSSNSRRKNRQPMKFKVENCEVLPPQVCLLCEEQFSGAAMLASHVFETHGIDMAQIVSGEAESPDRRSKKLPDLLKISDLKKDEPQPGTDPPSEDPPTLLPSHVCPSCPAVFTSRPDLFSHLRLKHPQQSSLLCGICLHPALTLQNLQNHLQLCAQQHPTTAKHVCQICHYSDDNPKSLENHVLVHDFLLDNCKKQMRIFDPADYVTTNDNVTTIKNLMCGECSLEDFDCFKEFSAHRRSQHSIFHCDLCNKFYGRNSHLWKHVNRLHKGHPSITCQICYKTSASKYHLAQHFNKIHTTKNHKSKTTTADSLSIIDSSSEDFMSQKFQAFDFQSVKQSFMRQELLEQENKKCVSTNKGDVVFDETSVDADYLDAITNKTESLAAPKEIDASSDLYTNIITNYTPPANEGEFKCPKCGKGFHKKNLLKKHKKNCRPRLQKDLLTRCKSCARIFKDRQSLAKHLVNYHSEYICEICSQKVQSKCEIVSHIRFSHPNCHLFCNICFNILRCKSDLEDHLHAHGESYVCQFCADALPSKIKLKMHILSLHRKILSLSCGVCLKLFETQHVLRDHVRLVHKDQLAPMTSCPVCGKNYGSKWKTYDHLNKSHGRIFKACKACLDVFDDEAQLQDHYDNVHSNAQLSAIKVGPPPPVSFQKVIEESESEHNDDDENINFLQSDDKESSSELLLVTDDKVKISLLEKRLLGNINSNNKPINNVKINDSDPTSQSSKRTVYVNSNDPSFCEICFKTWPAKKHLWQHYIRCHKSVAATVCGICLKTNECYTTLQTHLRETHPTLLHGQGFGSNFICRICGRYHNASSKLKLHMAIHENFDWDLLEFNARIEKRSPQVKSEKSNGYQINESQINYDSLIEQVECSSGSDTETDRVVIPNQMKSDCGDEENESSSSSSSSSDESLASDNSLEVEMLDNMIREKGGVKDEDLTSVSQEDSNNSCFSAKSESTDEGDGDVVQNFYFGCKTEELDSAIQSIKYECIEKVEHDLDEDYNEVQVSLNDNEIESAVGSIL